MVIACTVPGFSQEVVVAAMLDRFTLECDCAGLAFADYADPSTWHTRLRRGGIQQFVIFAVVQGLRERCAFEQRDRIQLGGDTRRTTQAEQVQRESVADIDAGGLFFGLLSAEIQTRDQDGVFPPPPQPPPKAKQNAPPRAPAPPPLSL